MQATTIDGRAVTLDPAATSALKARLKGPVLLPGDASYDESRTIWNGMIDRRPALVARALGVADVIACVQFVREHKVLLCIKGGGHNIAGLAVADGNYINFQTEDEMPERVAAALGGNLTRLAQVKRAWDPDNVFRTNKNIQPV